MRLTKLELTAFKSFAGVVLPVDAPRVLIGGLNGTGKTSVREGVKWALQGRCQATDGKGSGVGQLAPLGTSLVAVGLQDATGRHVSRQWKNGESTLTVSGFTGTAQAQQQGLYDHFKTDERFLSSVLDSSVYLDLHHADAKALILALLNVRIRLSDTDDHEYTLDEMDALHKTAFDKRRDHKRDLQRFGVPSKPAERSVPSLQAVDDQLAKLRKLLEDQQQALGAAGGSSDVLRKRKADVEELLTSCVNQIAALEALNLQQEIESIEERLAIIEADVPADPSLAGEVVNVEFLTTRSATIVKHDPKAGCILSTDIPCETAKKHFTKVAKAMQALIAAAPTADAPKSESPLTTVRKTLNGLKAKAAELTYFREHKPKLIWELTEIDEALKTAGDTTEAQKLVDETKARIAKGQDVRKDAEAYWTAQKAFEEAMATRVRMETELQTLEQTVDALGPNGLRAQALSAAMGRFEEAVNTFSTPFGFTFKMSVDPWEVMVNGRGLETYSKSEQYRIGIAIQLAIAAVSGLSFAIVDEVDMLDANNRMLLTKMIMTAPLEQVIILSTREDNQALPSGVPGLWAYRLGKDDGGRSFVAEQSAA